MEQRTPSLEEMPETWGGRSLDPSVTKWSRAHHLLHSPSLHPTLSSDVDEVRERQSLGVVCQQQIACCQRCYSVCDDEHTLAFCVAPWKQSCDWKDAFLLPQAHFLPHPFSALRHQFFSVPSLLLGVYTSFLAVEYCLENVDHNYPPMVVPTHFLPLCQNLNSVYIIKRRDKPLQH